MLGRFGGKPDHPMAQLRETRRILAELESRDAFGALEEITHWIRSVAETEGFGAGERLQRYCLLDEAAQSRERRVARDFLAVAGTGPFQEHRLGSLLAAFWSTLAQAYRSAFAQAASSARVAPNATLLPLAVARGFRAHGQQLKWALMRYQAPEPGVWQGLAAIYLFGESREILHTPVELYPGAPHPAPPVRELLKALMLWLAAPDALSPGKLEIAERLAGHLAEHFRLARHEGATVVHYFDLERPGPPGRVSPTAREKPHRVFISPGEAWSQLPRLAERVARGGVPLEVDGGLSLDPPMVIDVLRHLERHWSPQPPLRREARHRAAVPLRVVTGFDRILQALHGLEAVLADKLQRWTADNISSGGFSAQIPRRDGERLQVGTLLALQPEGAKRWGVGVVRRLSRGEPSQVGVETLAHGVLLVSLEVEGGSFPATRAGREAQQGILLGEDAARDEVRLVLKGGLYAPGRRLLMGLDREARLLVPVALEEQGDEFDLGRFRVVNSEAG